ncbi:MAG: formate/nitrite transporter family protein [Bacteroidia bacterium]|nr:formate/nitrite transporter family protein [Bacteroidia bacterium]
MFDIFRSAIFAGICISVGGIVNLTVGGIAGAVLFSFGLLTVVNYALKLYTGTAGFITNTKKDFGTLFLILLGNIVGCLLSGIAIRYANPDIVSAADAVVVKRMASGAIKCGVLGIGCGFVMTTAVKFAREGKFLPLLFGVPLFILCGFTHCVADAFYYCTASLHLMLQYPLEILGIYIATVLGNLIGCNLYRPFVKG